MASLKKNVSGQNVTFGLVSPSTGQPVTGASVTVYVTKDNGGQVTGGGSVTEKGHGQYNYGPTQAETNAIDVGFMFDATGAVCVERDFHTDVIDGQGNLQVGVASWNGFLITSDVNGIPLIGVGWWGGAITPLLPATEVAYGTSGIPNVNPVEWVGEAITSGLIGGGIYMNAIAGIRESTMQAGSTSTTAVLDIAANTTDHWYDGFVLYIWGGTGAEQVRILSDYVGATQTATVTPPWLVTPDGTSEFILLPAASVDVEMISASPTAAQKVSRANDSLVTGSVVGSPSTTAFSMGSLSVTPTVKNQFANRLLIFSYNTTTAGLRGAVCGVTSSDVTPAVIVTPLPALPQVGDTFTIV